MPVRTHRRSTELINVANLILLALPSTGCVTLYLSNYQLHVFFVLEDMASTNYLSIDIYCQISHKENEIYIP